MTMTGVYAAIIPRYESPRISHLDDEWKEVCYLVDHLIWRKTQNATAAEVFNYLKDEAGLCPRSGLAFEEIKNKLEDEGVHVTQGYFATLFGGATGSSPLLHKSDMPEFPEVLQDFEKYLSEQDKIDRAAVEDVLKAQKDLFMNMMKAKTQKEWDWYWVNAASSRREKEYREHVFRRFYDDGERCQKDCCKGIDLFDCCRIYELDHDGDAATTQKRIDQVILGRSNPSELDGDELEERRELLKMKCGVDHRLNTISLAVLDRNNPSYTPGRASRYESLRSLHLHFLTNKCAISGVQHLKVDHWIVLEGHHVCGLRKLKVGSGDPYPTEKKYKRHSLYKRGWNYTEWKEEVFPELLKLCHLDRRVHRMLELFLNLEGKEGFSELFDEYPYERKTRLLCKKK